jgi:hypothetical protein
MNKNSIARFPNIPECITVYITGPVSSGKTFLIKRLVERTPRSLILDAGADYLDSSYTHVWSNPKELAERIASNPHYYRIAYHPDANFFDEEFHWNFASIWSVSNPRWFIIEEAHQVCSINNVHPDLNTILRYSRHNFLGVIGSSQRLADVDKLFTSSARMVIMFHTAEFRDIEAARLRFGPDVADAIENLRPCIYNDATKVCEQEPECVVYMKGFGFRVIPLGSKIKTDKESNSIWDEQYQEIPAMPEEQSSEQDSGTLEPKSPESISEAS